jgi:hypothetical protein
MLKIDLQRYEFEGVDGTIHTFPGCSLVGLFEFQERIAELQQRLRSAADDLDVEQFYRSDLEFRHGVDRCLLLNGIAPHWCNWQIASQLLFAPGLLIEINQPPQKARSTVDAEPGTLAELIAGIAQVTGIQDAIELAKTQPAKSLLEIIDAYAEQQKTPEQKQKEGFDDWAERKRKQAEQRRQAVG